MKPTTFLLSQGCLNIGLLIGSSEWIPCFVLLIHAALALPPKLYLSQHASSCTFTFPVICPIPPGESKQEAVWCWAAAG